MANQWLRLWHDMPTDPKWRTIARISKQPISLVQATYIHILVEASRNVTRGHAAVTAEDLASALDVTDEDIEAILSAMQGRVLDGMQVLGWEKRQPKREDQGDENTGAKSAAQRKAEQRAREKAERESTKAPGCHDASRNVTLDKDKEEIREDVSSLRSETHGARDKADEEPSATKPTPAAAVCFAIRSAGIAQVNPAHPELLGLLEQGAEISHFVEAAKIAKDKGKPFAYVLGIVKSQLADGRALVDAIQTRSTRRHAAEPKETFRERDERLAREKMAAFLPGIAAKAPKDQYPANVIDVTPTNTSEIAHVVPHQLGR